MVMIVPAAARTLAVFEIFAREKRELLKSEVARLLSLPESSCSDLLGTLEELGYVSRTVNSKRYYPTSRFLVVAKAISEHDELQAITAEAAALLSERTGESCYAGELDDADVRIIAMHDGVHSLRYFAQVGDRVAIHATAIGKALLAGLPNEERAPFLSLKPLPSLTANIKIKPETLKNEIAGHPALGWFEALDEGGDGLASFAVAGWSGNRLIGLSVIGPTARMSAQRTAYIEHLLDVRKRVFGPAD